MVPALGNPAAVLLAPVAVVATLISMVPLPVLIVAVSVTASVGVRGSIRCWRAVGAWSVSVRLAWLACRAVAVLLSRVADRRSVGRLAVPSSVCRSAAGVEPGRHERAHQELPHLVASTSQSSHRRGGEEGRTYCFTSDTRTKVQLMGRRTAAPRRDPVRHSTERRFLRGPIAAQRTRWRRGDAATARRPCRS